MATLRRLAIYLIKPSKYDEDGYVIRCWRGMMLSNTLACLYGLTEDVRQRGILGRELASAALLGIDRRGWLDAAHRQTEFFDRFGGRIPTALLEEQQPSRHDSKRGQ